MFNKNYLRKFSIRKLKVSAASVFIGLSFLGASSVSAETLKLGVEKDINYKYVLESELTDSEKQLIVKELPSDKVGEYETYYMVYRPESDQVLPKTIAMTGDNGLNYLASGALGLGLLVLAVKFSKKKKKYIISSIFILTAAGTYSVSAIENVKLAGNDKVYTVKTGQELPETKIAIPGHQFVGYILVDTAKDLKEDCPPEEKITTTPKQVVQTAANVVVKPQGQVVSVPVVTEKPVTRPAEVPVTRIVTEAPVTRVITQAPVTKVVTEAPATKVVSNESTTVVVTEVPVTKVITEVPVTQIVTEQPVTKVITEAPVTKVVTEKGEPLVEGTKPEIVIETSKGTGVTVPSLEEAPVPEITSKGNGVTSPALEEAPIPEITSKGTGVTVPSLEEASLPTSTTTTSSTTLSTTTVSTETSSTTTKSETSSETTTKAVVDKTKLQEEYGLENDSKQTDKYKYATDDLRTAYDKLLTEANTILANPDATQAQVDEALKLLTDARVKLNGLLVEGTEEKEFTRIIDFVDETGKSIRTAEEQKVKFIRNVIKNGNTGQVVETKDWTSVKDFFEKFVPPGIEGYKTDETEVPQLPVQVLATQETTRVSVRYNKVTEEKVKPDLKVTKLEKFDKEKRATLTFDLVDKDSTYVKGQVKVYNDKNELVQTVDIKDNKVDLSNLEHCIPYRLETILTYNLGKGEVEEKVDTRTIELVDKKIEFKNLISTELYKVDDTGKATQVTALTSLPNDKENYMIKLVDSENKEILLAVDKIVEKNGKYQVSAKMDNLVHYVNDTTSEDFVFEIDKAVVKKDHYSTFKELITAMNANLSGTFYLAADMIVDGEFTGDAYVSGNFTGSLQSETGKNFSISGMKKPLFNNLAAGSRVSNLEIKDAKVSNTGILAKSADNSTIDKLKLSGSLTPTSVVNPVGGVIGGATAVTLTNSMIDVKLGLPNSGAYQTYAAGGIFGKFAGTGKVSKLSVNVDISAPNGNYGETVGGIAGEVAGGIFEKIQVTGKVVADQEANSVAAIIGKITGSTVNDIITGVKVNKGSIGNGASPMLMWMPHLAPKNMFTINDVASGNAQMRPLTATGIPQTEADKKAQEWGLPKGTSSSTGATTGAGTAPTSASAATYPVDYTKVTGAKAGFETAYKNLAKLLPFYDRKTIVKTANKLADGDKLKSTAITSIVPMKGNDFVTDLYNTTGVDKLLIHFADGKVQEYNLTATGESPNSRITEFKLDNGMLYTPHILKQGTPTTLTDAINELKATGLHTEAIRDVLGINKLEQHEKERLKSFNIDLVKGLYLDDSFNNVKANLEEVLNSIISSQFASITENEAISRYLNSEVKKDKEKILLGLAYLNRWYNIDFGTKNIKDLALYRPDFFGNNAVNVIDYLKEIGGAGYEKLSQQGTAAADLYKERIAPYTGQDDIYKYLEKNKELFEPTKTVQDWFKESSKVHIVEADKLVESSTNDLYERIKKSPASHSRWLLPVLTAEKDTIFAVVHTPSISVGSFDRYISPTDIADPAKRQAKVDEIKNTTLPKYAKSLADYYKFWYNSADASVRDKFAEKTVNIFDGMNINNINTQDQAGPWAGRYSDFSYVEDFAGPIGAWFPESKSESAYTDLKTMINMQTSRLLEDTGFATLGHELVHFFDKEILLNGHGHRVGQNVESYATGLLESPSGTGTQGYGLNIMFENGDVLSTVNRNKSRFTKAQDFKEYMNRFYDITYTLDGLEANAILSLDKAKQAEFFEQISTVTNNVLEPDGVTRSRVSDVIKPVTNYANLNITSIEGLINNNLVMKGILNMNGKQEFSTDNSLNNYTEVPLYKPIYAAPATETGVGSLQFRKTAFDVLAEKGWDEGFIKYASNQLANISDKAVLESIFGANFNYQTFRANQFNSRLANVANLKPITVSGSQLDGKALENKIKEIITSNKPTRDKIYDMQVLKENVIKAYLKETNDLRTSIYK